MMKLPAEWKWVLFEDYIASAQNGFGRRPNGIENGPIVLRIADVSSGHIDLSNPRQVSMSKAEFNNYKIENGDIIFIRVNGSKDLVARSIPVEHSYENVAFNDHLIRVKLKKGLNTKYLNELTNLGWFRAKILASIPTSAGGQLTINQQNLGEFKLPLPPLPEQRKIVKILSTWERAIELVGRQIEAKQRLKKGLMQQLLTGKMRFPGFDGEWKEVRLEKIASINSQTLAEDTDSNYSFYYLTISDVSEGEFNFPAKKISFGEASSRARRQFEKSDILLSTVRPNLRGFGIVDFDCKEFICSTGFAVIHADKTKVDPKFIYYSTYSHHTEKYFYACVTGSNYPALSNNDVKKMKLLLPTLNEQHMIVSLLSSQDKEIKLLQNKRENLLKQKQGLMQKLLTGEVRVKV